MKKKLVFIAVGTHPQQFNRLLQEADRIAERTKNARFFAQSGASDYIPKNFPLKKALGLEEFDAWMRKADAVISHGGEGVIGRALQLGKPLIMVPRLESFGEHTNDHQLELVEAVSKAKKIPAILDIQNLQKAVEKALEEKKKPARKSSPTKIIKILGNYFKKEFKAVF